MRRLFAAAVALLVLLAASCRRRRGAYASRGGRDAVSNPHRYGGGRRSRDRNAHALLHTDTHTRSGASRDRDARGPWLVGAAGDGDTNLDAFAHP